jgi:hypothetical protein
VFLGGFGGLYILLLVDLRGLVGFYLLENNMEPPKMYSIWNMFVPSGIN